MVTKQVLAQGMQVGVVQGSAAKVAYKLQSTQSRWSDLQWAMLARASNLRAAGRRANRKVGMPLARLPYWVSHRKATAKRIL